jgi:hypothetical protein
MKKLIVILCVVLILAIFRDWEVRVYQSGDAYKGMELDTVARHSSLCVLNAKRIDSTSQFLCLSTGGLAQNPKGDLIYVNVFSLNTNLKVGDHITEAVIVEQRGKKLPYIALTSFHSRRNQR